MSLRNNSKTQEVAAAQSGISVRSARRIDKGDLTQEKEQQRWRTRKDPLVDVWSCDLIPLLEKQPGLTPITLFEWLDDNYPGRYSKSVFRTLQRRVKEWKTIHGPEKEVMFRQQKVPGRMGLSDFTKWKGKPITINGETFSHLLYHFRMAFSGWRYVKVISGGESFTALSSGLQNALWLMGGVPLEHRTDSLSAAYINNAEHKAFTANYEQLCRHYKLTPTRNNVGVAHENGAIESPHGHLKKRIEQALLMRGSTDFDSVDAYQQFIEQIVHKLNRQCREAFIEEKQALQDLPKRRTNEHTELYVRVSSSSTICIKRITYTVPSKLIGEKICVQLFDDQLRLFVGHVHVETLTRLYVPGTQRGRSVNYKHVIHSLVRKPQAFRYCQYREELLPDDNYKLIWKLCNQVKEPEQASKYMVQLLSLAANYDCEQVLSRYILNNWRSKGQLPSIDNCRRQFVPESPCRPVIHSRQHELSSYNQLFENYGEVKA